MTLDEAKERYLFDLERRNYSDQTLYLYRHHINFFIKWVHETIGNVTLHDLTQEHMFTYSDFLLSIDKQQQSESYRIARLRNIKRFFSFLKSTSLILLNPCEGLPAIKESQSLPKQLLNVSDLKKLLDFEPCSKYEHLQKTIFMTAFAGGLRRRELINLSIYDVNLRESSIRVNEGKGKKDRIVPIGQQCLDVLSHFIDVERPKFMKLKGEDHLFLSNRGTELSYNGMGNLFKNLAQKLDIPRLTCHLLRHQSSVELVRNGMNLRYLQEYLNHSHLQTVEIYTRLAPTDLKKAHEKADPRKRMNLKALGEDLPAKPSFFKKSKKAIKKSK